MPKDLILNSLEIQRFRCFRELRIGHLGRVNLIVGKNNVGKSTILEALRLFAKPASLVDLLDMLACRNEISTGDIEAWRRDPEYPLRIDSSFFGRRSTPGEEGAIVIGPVERKDDCLRISMDIREYSVKVVPPPFDKLDRNIYVDLPCETLRVRETVLTFRLGSTIQGFRLGSPQFHRPPSNSPALFPLPESSQSNSISLRTIPYCSIEPNGVSLTDIGRLWDDVSLSPLEKDVVSALRIISPEVDRLALKVARDGNNGDSVNRIPFVKVESFEEPIPLRALGDGVNRLFGVALALAHAKDGLLLVDEIENGIHYTVQADLWRLVFETAARLNVQVFATTHSYDCIKAFEEAARESEEEGVLVRLARKGDRTLVGEFDERELEIAVEGEIEVR
jgi:energy-coupling factor transporter ATP-binding protein EcfA2